MVGVGVRSGCFGTFGGGVDASGPAFVGLCVRIRRGDRVGDRSLAEVLFAGCDGREYVKNRR